MTDKANRWRKRAEELRTWAAEVHDQQAREGLLIAAEQWDRMASQQERYGNKEPA